MPTPSDARVEDIARIAFVTRRFRELQGLTPTMFGAGLIAGPLLAHGMSPAYVASPVQAWNFANAGFLIAAFHMHRMYLIGTVASAAMLFISTRADPARSLAILVFASSGALMLEGLLDYFVATRHPRITGPSDHEAVNVDPI